MLPKSSRLTAAEVPKVLKEGRSARAGGVSLKYTPASRGKAAVVVSTKVAKLAVVRNKLRRAGYASLLLPLPPYHMVFFIQRAALEPADIAALCSKLS